MISNPIFDYLSRLMKGEISRLSEEEREAVIQQMCTAFEINPNLNPFRWDRSEEGLWRVVPTRGFASWACKAYVISVETETAFQGGRYIIKGRAEKGGHRTEAIVTRPRTATDEELAGAETVAQLKAILKHLGWYGMWFEEKVADRSKRYRAAVTAGLSETLEYFDNINRPTAEIMAALEDEGVPPELGENPTRAQLRSWIENLKAMPKYLPIIRRVCLQLSGATRTDEVAAILRRRVEAAEKEEASPILREVPA